MMYKGAFYGKNTLQMHHKIRHICTPCFRHLVFLWHFTWCFCAISLGVFAVMRQTTLNSPALITRGHYKDWEENQSAFPCWTGRVARSNATPNKHSTTIQTIFDNRSNSFRTVNYPSPYINAGQTIRIGPGAFDKMSNEGLYRGNAYAKGRVSAQRKDSGAFRKIHNDSRRGIFLLFG